MAPLSWTVYVKATLHNTQLLECQPRHGTRTTSQSRWETPEAAKNFCLQNVMCMLHLIFCSRNCINIEMISDQRSQRGSEKITKNYLKVQHFLTYVSIAIIHWQWKVPPLSEFKRNEYEILFFKEMHLQPPCQCLVNTLKRAICHSSAPNAWEKNSWYWALLSWI